MIELVPERRLNAKILLNHQWFDNDMQKQKGFCLYIYVWFVLTVFVCLFVCLGFDEKTECKNENENDWSTKRRKSVPICDKFQNNASMKRVPFKDVTTFTTNQNSQVYCFGSIKVKNNTDPTRKCHIYQREEVNICNNGSLTKCSSNTSIRHKKRSRKQYEEYDRLIMQNMKRSQT